MNKVITGVGALGAAAVALVSAQVLPGRTTATVSRVIDGDTVVVAIGDRRESVRMACIDAPELAQKPWGEKSKWNLSAYLNVGDRVEIRVSDRDRYGRLVGEIYDQGESTNLKQIKDGMAALYTDYLSECSASRQEYLDTELKAQEGRVGFWNDVSMEMPWDYRRNH